jgi:y4mF family transcriptional regulator
MNNLSLFIKYHRKKLGLTQQDLAEKAGVGIRFIRELEHGKETLQLNKVNQVLNLFGFQLTIGKQQIDAYDIYWNYLNKAIKITLNNRIIKYGIIVNEIIGSDENKITAWKFVSNNNAFSYRKKTNENLTEIILHKDIQKIEEQQSLYK